MSQLMSRLPFNPLHVQLTLDHVSIADLPLLLIVARLEVAHSVIEFILGISLQRMDIKEDEKLKPKFHSRLVSLT